MEGVVSVFRVHPFFLGIIRAVEVVQTFIPGRGQSIERKRKKRFNTMARREKGHGLGYDAMPPGLGGGLEDKGYFRTK
jgi:hypothetical protein